MTTAPAELAQTSTTDDAANAAHIVMAPDGVSPQALVLEARIEGIPVTALCGHTWIPQRDPKPLPVCSRCLDIYQQPGDHRDERDELPEA